MIPFKSKDRPPEVWAIIHLTTFKRAYRYAESAARMGLAGVFVTSTLGRDDDIDTAAIEIQRRHPGLKVGANYTQSIAHAALIRSLGLGLNATWADIPGVRSDGIDRYWVSAIRDVLNVNRPHLLFGSIAFKYQPIDQDPAGAALRAIGVGMVPTTSGDAHVAEPPVSKLRGIRSAIENGPLALAGGVTPENVRQLAPYLTHVLVPAGASEDDDEFDEPRLQRLMTELHAA